jgi:acid phosphatase
LRPISRRSALQGLASVFAGSLTASWARAAGPALTFLAVGDWGRDGTNNQSEVAARMGETAALLGARFVISVGDNFYEDGVASVTDPKWRTSFEDVYSAPSLHVPWHVILGNHDYHGDTQAQIAYSARSRRWRLPSRWYSRTERGPDGTSLEIFFLDTSPFISAYYRDGGAKVKVVGQDTGAQLAWFDGALAASRADWKIVVGHHPIHSGRDPASTADLKARIDPILQRHEVPLYLNGHDHDLQHFADRATHYVCTGAGSKVDDHCDLAGGDFCSIRSGFTAFHLTRGRLDVAFRDYAGAELHVVRIERPG